MYLCIYPSAAAVAAAFVVVAVAAGVCWRSQRQSAASTLAKRLAMQNRISRNMAHDTVDTQSQTVAYLADTCLACGLRSVRRL